MSNVLVAVEVLTALTQLVMRVSAATNEVSSMIKKAQEEGRDLTDEEIEQVKSIREDAMSRWDALMNDVE